MFNSMVLSGCLHNNFNNDSRFILEASTSSKLKIVVDAVSANYDIKKTFVLSDNCSGSLSK